MACLVLCIGKSTEHEIFSHCFFCLACACLIPRCCRFRCLWRIRRADLCLRPSCTRRSLSLSERRLLRSGACVCLGSKDSKNTNDGSILLLTRIEVSTYFARKIPLLDDAFPTPDPRYLLWDCDIISFLCPVSRLVDATTET